MGGRRVGAKSVAAVASCAKRGQTKQAEEPTKQPAPAEEPTTPEPTTAALRVQAEAQSERLKTTRGLLANETEAEPRRALQLREQAPDGELRRCLKEKAAAQSALVPRCSPQGAPSSSCPAATAVVKVEAESPQARSA
jgi:hypothetical protein